MADEVAEVRVVHAGLGLGPVDVYVVGAEEPWFEDLEYGETSDRIEVTPQLRTFALRPAGAPPDATPVYTSPDFLLEDDDRITVVFGGVAGASDEDERLRLIPVAEDWGPPLQQRARARVVHVGSDAPRIRLDGVINDAVGRFESTGADGFGVATEGGVLELSRDAGSGSELLTQFTLPPTAEGEELLLIASGRLQSLARDPDGLSLVVVGREGTLELVRQDPQLFVLHGSRDAGALETCLAGEEIAANIAYGELQSGRVSPGQYSLDIVNYPSGCLDEPLNSNFTQALEAGQRYLVLLTGEVTPDALEAGIQVATFDDAFPVLEDDRARVRFVHGASYTQVFVGVVQDTLIGEGAALTDGIAWSVESVEVEVPEGNYVLGIADAATGVELPAAPLVTIPYQAQPGARQWAIVSGDPSPEDGDGFLQVMIVDTAAPEWLVTVSDVDIPGA